MGQKPLPFSERSSICKLTALAIFVGLWRLVPLDSFKSAAKFDEALAPARIISQVWATLGAALFAVASKQQKQFQFSASQQLVWFCACSSSVRVGSNFKYNDKALQVEGLFDEAQTSEDRVGEPAAA